MENIYFDTTFTITDITVEQAAMFSEIIKERDSLYVGETGILGETGSGRFIGLFKVDNYWHIATSGLEKSTYFKESIGLTWAGFYGSYEEVELFGDIAEYKYVNDDWQKELANRNRFAEDFRKKFGLEDVFQSEIKKRRELLEFVIENSPVETEGVNLDGIIYRPDFKDSLVMERVLDEASRKWKRDMVDKWREKVPYPEAKPRVRGAKRPLGL